MRNQLKLSLFSFVLAFIASNPCMGIAELDCPNPFNRPNAHFACLALYGGGNGYLYWYAYAGVQAYPDRQVTKAAWEATRGLAAAVETAITNLRNRGADISPSLSQLRHELYNAAQTSIGIKVLAMLPFSATPSSTTLLDQYRVMYYIGTLEYQLGIALTHQNPQ